MAELRLRQYLEEKQIAASKLADVAGISNQAIYNLTSVKEPAQAIKFDTLTKLLKALDQLTGESVQVSDLIVRG